MQLEDYLQFEKFGEVERIRIKGTRINLEHIIEPYQKGLSPEEMVNQYYPSLTLRQVYAAITYYLENKDSVETYLAEGRRLEEAAYQEHLKKEPPEVVKRLKALRAEQETKAGGSA